MNATRWQVPRIAQTLVLLGYPKTECEP
jgi:hypothetical protein